MNLKKQLRVLLLVLVFNLLAACTKSSTTTDSASSKTLNLYCWSNYFSPELIQKFEKATNTKVVFNYFSSNEELLAKLQAGARGYDLIVPSGYLLKPLKELNLIQPLGEFSKSPALNALNSRFKAPAFDPKHEYSVPYSWGTTGIAVNKTKVKERVDSLAWLFTKPELKNQVTMLDDAPTVIGTALKFLGYSFNEGSHEALEKAKELLKKQKTWLKSYTPESQPVLESGEFVVAQAYSGDVLQVKRRKNLDIEFIHPKEGGEYFVDTFAIPTGAPHAELAKQFIEYTLNKEVALTQVEHLFFSPVVDISSLQSGKSAIFGNTTIFPSDATLKNFEMVIDNPERISALEKIWTELKSH
jgi:spermidine/putrescine transport system substrate-binding protein